MAGGPNGRAERYHRSYCANGVRHYWRESGGACSSSCSPPCASFGAERGIADRIESSPSSSGSLSFPELDVERAFTAANCLPAGEHGAPACLYEARHPELIPVR